MTDIDVDNKSNLGHVDNARLLGNFFVHNLGTKLKINCGSPIFLIEKNFVDKVSGHKQEMN